MSNNKQDIQISESFSEDEIPNWMSLPYELTLAIGQTYLSIVCQPIVFRGILRLVCKVWSEIFAFKTPPIFLNLVCELASVDPHIRQFVNLNDAIRHRREVDSIIYYSEGELMIRHRNDVDSIISYSDSELMMIYECMWRHLFRNHFPEFQFLLKYAPLEIRALSFYVVGKRCTGKTSLIKDILVKLLPYVTGGCPMFYECQRLHVPKKDLPEKDGIGSGGP